MFRLSFFSHLHVVTPGYFNIHGDQKVSVHLMIVLYSLGAQRPFDHPVQLTLLSGKRSRLHKF